MRPHNESATAGAALVVALALILAACGSSSNARGSSTTSGALGSGEQASAQSDPSSAATTQPTRSAPTTQEASEPEVVDVYYEGLRYVCDKGSPGDWTCHYLANTVYCEGLSAPTSCSDLWFPSQIANVRLVTFEGRDYACQKYETSCVLYTGGPPPLSFYTPDLWCDGLECSHYDPDVWTKITFEFSDYLCTERTFQFDEFDCYKTIGDTQPTLLVSPDLFCSGFEYAMTCDKRWYPDELQSFEFISISGIDYLCTPSYLGSYGDYDCGAYQSGDPNLVWTGQLKCTDRGYSFDCDSGYYPSELDGLTVTYISGSQYLCRSTWGGSECFLYLGGSPSMAVIGLPDLYCNTQGLCDTWGYP